MAQVAEAGGNANGGDIGGHNRPPYDYIVHEIKGGYVIPFLGAGASVFHRPANGNGTDPVASPPTVGELVDHLAHLGRFPPDAPHEKRSNLPLVASYYGLVTADEFSLRRELRNKFWPEFELNELHLLLRDIAKEKNLLIVTTNYDDMVERAFKAEGVPYHLVVTNIADIERAGTLQYCEPGGSKINYVQPNKLPVSLEDASIIYKMHGSINRTDREDDGYVITEEHYVRFLGGLSSKDLYVPRSIAAMMKSRHFLFLGYGLKDWNLRVILDTVSQFGRTQSWAIQADPDLVEKNLWAKKKVDVYGVDLRDFVKDLRTYFDGNP